MAKCPHGEHELRLPDNAEANMYHYHSQCVVVTDCCGEAVRAWPVTIYRAEAYTGAMTEDDWGKPIRAAKAA